MDRMSPSGIGSRIRHHLGRPSRILPLLAVTALLAAVPAAAAAAAATTVSYVSLGDSYTAGLLIPNATGNPIGCLRSTSNYPSLTAAAIGATSFTDISCSGATTADMTQSQPVLLGTNPPQLSALSSATTVVTLGIGGNDIGFSSIISTCTSDSWSNPLGSPCKNHYTAGGTDQIAAAINATGPRLAAVLQAIHADAPNARIFVVGYPDLLPAAG